MTSMVRRFAFLVFLAACVIVTSASTAVNSEGGASASTPPRRRPNFVLFLVDDLGYGDLSCFGNETIRTPNIDEMAANGVKLTSLISAAPICTPSRAAILTGRYPVRSGMTSAHNNFRTYMSAAQPGGLPLKEITLAEKLKEANYSTALIGKWHLGVNSKTISRKSGEPTQNGRHLPTEHGFDYFFGMPLTNVQTCGNKPLLDVMSPRTYWRFPTGRRIIIAFGVGILTAMILYFTGTIGFLAMSCWVAFTWLVGFGLFYVIFRYTVLNPRSCTLMRNKEIVEQPIRLPGLTQRLTAEAQSYITQHKDEPFFLFFSDVKVHTALFTGSEFAGRSGKGDFVDNVEEMDWSVGELVRTLRENGLENDTVIFFTSDNGPFLEEGHEAGTAGYILDNLGRRANFKGGKGTNYEGGVRVPGIVQYKGHVRPQVSDQLVSTMDIMPTFLSLANVPLPSDRAIDGKDLSPLLFSDSALLPGGCTPPLGSDGGSTSAEDNFATVSAPPLTAAGSAAPNVSLIHNALFHWCGPSVTAIRHGHFKAHFQADKFDIEHQAPGGPHKCEECCPDRVICRCDGYKLDPPLLYNLFEDPGERRPINPSSELYQNELTIMRALIEAHEASLLSAPDTSHSQLEVLPRPWLEPCCNPPHCRCCHQCSPQEEREHQLKWASLLV